MRAFALLLPAVLLFGALPASADDAPASALWASKCATCHGDDGRGQTKAGRKHKVPDFTDAAFQAKARDEGLLAAIRDGKPETKMKGFAGKLSAAELASLVAYVRAFGKR